MIANNAGLKETAKKNVLTTDEACKIINRTRQQLNNLLRKGDITVLKPTTNGNLFWRPDVYDLLRKINHERLRSPHKIYGDSSTHQALDDLDSLNIDPNTISEVYVFFSAKDAIIKNFYNLSSVEMPDTLTRIEGARFIVILDDGTEYWFDNLTCGYWGEGCRGTKTALKKLGINIADIDLGDVINDNKVLHFIHNDNKWTVEADPSMFNDDDKSNIKDSDLVGIEENLYRYNGKLVLTQSNRYRTVYGERPEPSKEVLFKSLFFVPEPVTISLISESDALDTGHYQNSFGQTILYQVIIRDLSDRELWLNYPLDQIPRKDGHNMAELLDYLGVQVDKSIMDKYHEWFSKKPRYLHGVFDIYK